MSTESLDSSDRIPRRVEITIPRRIWHIVCARALNSHADGFGGLFTTHPEEARRELAWAFDSNDPHQGITRVRDAQTGEALAVRPGPCEISTELVVSVPLRGARAREVFGRVSTKVVAAIDWPTDAPIGFVATTPPGPS